MLFSLLCISVIIFLSSGKMKILSTKLFIIFLLLFPNQPDLNDALKLDAGVNESAHRFIDNESRQISAFKINGTQMVDLESLVAAEVLNPAGKNLDFIRVMTSGSLSRKNHM